MTPELLILRQSIVHKNNQIPEMDSEIEKIMLESDLRELVQQLQEKCSHPLVVILSHEKKESTLYNGGYQVYPEWRKCLFCDLDETACLESEDYFPQLSNPTFDCSEADGLSMTVSYPLSFTWEIVQEKIRSLAKEIVTPFGVSINLLRIRDRYQNSQKRIQNDLERLRQNCQHQKVIVTHEASYLWYDGACTDGEELPEERSCLICGTREEAFKKEDFQFLKSDALFCTKNNTPKELLNAPSLSLEEIQKLIQKYERSNSQS